MAQNPNQPNLNQTQQEIRDIAAMTEDTFRSVADNIQNIFRDALQQGQNVSKSLGNDISNNLKSIARVSVDAISNQEKLNRGILKESDIQKQIESRLSKIQAIELQIEVMKKSGMKVNKQTLEDLHNTIKINDAYTDKLKEQQQLIKDSTKETQKSLGFVPKLLSGLDKSLSKLGIPDLGFNDAYKKTIELGIAAKAAGDNGFNSWGTYTKQLGSNLKEVLSATNLIQISIGFLIDAFLKLDNLAGDTAKSMGISYSSATQLNTEFNGMANRSNNIFVTTKGINESFNQINQALGTNGQLSEELLVTQTELVKQAFYSVEAATMLSKLSLATGKPTKEITTQFLGQAKALNLVNNTAINEKQLLESISKVSKATLATFAAQPGKLAAAAYEAKRLGLELSQIEAIQSSLLDIESSIAAEFEAEVITGKQLNLEAARYYALTNDLAGVAKELSAQGVTQAKFAGMTVIEQEAIAKAMGMSRDQMGGMLMEQEAISKLSSIDGKNAKEKYENAVKLYGVEKANAMLGDETLAQQMQSASMQDKFNASVEKLKEIFTTVVQAMIPMMDILSGVLELIGYIVAPIQLISDTFNSIGEKISSMLGPLGKLGKAVKVLAGLAIVFAAYKAFASLAANPVLALIPGAGIAAGAIAAAAITTAGFGMINKIGDLSSPASGKTQVSTKEGGLFELSKNDDLVAAPGLINKLNSPSTPLVINQPSAPQTPMINYDKMAQAMSRVQVQTNLDGVRVSSELQKAPLGMATRKI
jgi:hypothetical protein